MDEPKARFIFVGGAARSGTTLVQRLLNAHPDVHGGPEFDHVPRIMALRDQMLRGIETGRIDGFLSRDELDAAFTVFFASLFTPVAARTGCRIISEKTPDNVLYASRLLELFPDAHFVFCVRDPRAVVSSLLAVGRRAHARGTKRALYTRHVRPAVNHVRAANDAGFRAIERHPGRTHLIRYEDVVERPAVSLQKLCAKLGIAWEPAMLCPKSDSSHAASGPEDGIWYSRERFERAPHPGRQDAWRTELPSRDARFVTRAFAPDPRLRALGYALEADDGTVGSQWLDRGIDAITNRAADQVGKTRKLVAGWLARKGLL